MIKVWIRFWMSARAHVEVSTTAGMIGFHDSVPTLNHVLAEVRVGDRVYFYVTREMRLAAQAQIAREVFGIQARFSRRLAMGEIFARRIGIEMEKDGLDIPFRISWSRS